MKKIISAIIAVSVVVTGICIYGTLNNIEKNKEAKATMTYQKNKENKESNEDNKKSQTDKNKEKDAETKKTGTEVAKLKQTHDFTTNYGIMVEISEQRVYIYKNDKILKTMACSTGVDGKDTPVGNFKILRKQTKFYSKKYQQGGYFWLEFIKGGNYLFHSVPFDKSGEIIKEEEEKLGQKASHGCVRVSLENSKWLYDNIPSGTEVIINK